MLATIDLESRVLYTSIVLVVGSFKPSSLAMCDDSNIHADLLCKKRIVRKFSQENAIFFLARASLLIVLQGATGEKILQAIGQKVDDTRGQRI